MPTIAALAVAGPVLTVAPITLIPWFVAVAVFGVGVGVGAFGMLVVTDFVHARARRLEAEAERPPEPRPLNAVERVLARLLMGVSREEMRSGELRADSLGMVAAVLAPPPPPTPTPMPSPAPMPMPTRIGTFQALPDDPDVPSEEEPGAQSA
jgi:hypothetical protein